MQEIVVSFSQTIVKRKKCRRKASNHPAMLQASALTQHVESKRESQSSKTEKLF